MTTLNWTTLDLEWPLRVETDPIRLVAQRALVTMNTIAGTWWLDGAFGLKLLERWLVKAPDLRLIEADLRRVMMAVPGVLRVRDVTLDFRAVERVLVVGFVLVTEAGDITAQTVEVGSGEVGSVLEPGRFYLMMSGPGGQIGLGAGVVR